MWRFYRNSFATIGVLGIYPLCVLLEMLVQMAIVGSLAIPESTNTAALMLLPLLIFFRYLFVPFDEMSQTNVYKGAFWGFLTIVTILVVVGAFSPIFHYDGFLTGCTIALPIGILAFCLFPFFADFKDSHYARSDNH